MTPEQCRAARAILGWSQEKLGTAAGGLTFQVISKFERGLPGALSAKTVQEIKNALEGQGIIFFETGDYIYVGRVKR
jgi:transcriptional regulator with XRE-family HTH domain